ncbi:MAG: hypothetical protein LBB11_03210 [Puniceicoccales bacterium]|jgi:hypothetical protein|nr:hypothetical protein [Puniceicoccales bacterium]
MAKIVLRKIVGVILLMYPLISQGWNVVIDGRGNVLTENSAIDKEKATILIQNGEFSVRYGQFWLYWPDVIGETYNFKQCYLPDVPLFVPVDGEEFYQYVLSKEGNVNKSNESSLGKTESEILNPDGDVLCCLQLLRNKNAMKGEKKKFIEHVVFYRYNTGNRYFFLAPAAKLHKLIQFALAGGAKRAFKLYIGIDGEVDSSEDAKNKITSFPNWFAPRNYYIKNDGNEFNTMTLRENDGFALSGLASQGWIGWTGNDTGWKGKYSLPGINLEDQSVAHKGENRSITTQVLIGDVTLLTHHIFLNQGSIEKIQEALFGSNDRLPEGLKDCNTSKYGDLTSFVIKLLDATSDENSRKSVLGNVIERLATELDAETNPSHESSQYVVKKLSGEQVPFRTWLENKKAAQKEVPQRKVLKEETPQRKAPKEETPQRKVLKKETPPGKAPKNKIPPNPLKQIPQEENFQNNPLPDLSDEYIQSHFNSIANDIVKKCRTGSISADEAVTELKQLKERGIKLGIMVVRIQSALSEVERHRMYPKNYK